MSAFTRVRVVGRGRVGGAVAARLLERGLLVEDSGVDLVLLCVPDSAIATVAGSIAVGPWVAHVSGATPLSVLAPHTKRFSVHPLQTFTRARGPEQIDGAWAAITGETDDARAAAWYLASLLELQGFDLRDEDRAIYHAGAAIASNFLVALHRAAVRAVRAAGAPPDALLPLMRRTIDNGFDLTGPIARGDQATIDAHLAAIRRDMPDLEPMYRALRGRDPAMIVTRTIAACRTALSSRGSGRRTGFVPTLGALHDGHVALVRAARRECDMVAASVFVNPKQFNDPSDLAKYPRQEDRDTAILLDAGVDVLFLPSVEEMYPAGEVTSIEMRGPALGFEGAYRPGHFNGVAIVCLKLFSIVEPDVVYLGQKDAQQVAVVRQLARDVALRLEIAVVPTIRDTDGLALSSRNVRLSLDERRRALAIPQALRAGVRAYRGGDDPVGAARAVLGGLDVDYCDVAVFDGTPTLVIAARSGLTRLIDNVPLTAPEQAGLS